MLFNFVFLLLYFFLTLLIQQFLLVLIMMNLPAMNGDSFNNAIWYLTSSIEERVPLAGLR